MEPNSSNMVNLIKQLPKYQTASMSWCLFSKDSGWSRRNYLPLMVISTQILVYMSKISKTYLHHLLDLSLLRLKHLYCLSMTKFRKYSTIITYMNSNHMLINSESIRKYKLVSNWTSRLWKLLLIINFKVCVNFSLHQRSPITNSYFRNFNRFIVKSIYFLAITFLLYFLNRFSKFFALLGRLEKFKAGLKTLYTYLHIFPILILQFEERFQGLGIHLEF